VKTNQEILNLYKLEGETPLECILRFKKNHPEYEKVNMTYAGRLDPMARGVLLVLAGKINEQSKKEVMELGKEYEFEILWGFTTDSYDVLGLVLEVNNMPLKNFDRKILPLLKNIQKKKTQAYPPFSSRTVLGKALHAWAREGKIDEVEIPTRHVSIFTLEHVHTRLVSQKDILEDIISRISKVKGDFRQEEIMKRWKEVIEPNEQALISLCRAEVSSGTYIRSLAQEMGEILGCGAVAYSIKRTRVGEYNQMKSQK
jgi:tRNA pseudouridine55 synthase